MTSFPSLGNMSRTRTRHDLSCCHRWQRRFMFFDSLQGYRDLAGKQAASAYQVGGRCRLSLNFISVRFSRRAEKAAGRASRRCSRLPLFPAGTSSRRLTGVNHSNPEESSGFRPSRLGWLTPFSFRCEMSGSDIILIAFAAIVGFTWLMHLPA